MIIISLRWIPSLFIVIPRWHVMHVSWVTSTRQSFSSFLFFILSVCCFPRWREEKIHDQEEYTDQCRGERETDIQLMTWSWNTTFSPLSLLPSIVVSFLCFFFPKHFVPDRTCLSPLQQRMVIIIDDQVDRKTSNKGREKTTCESLEESFLSSRVTRVRLKLL